jgi:hypothetical protein
VTPPARIQADAWLQLLWDLQAQIRLHLRLTTT